MDEENREILYSKLKMNINQLHPNKGGKSFGVCENLGSYGLCSKNIKITELSKEIGIGPTMFLLATKSLAWLFFFCTIINIPVFAFYFTSNPTTGDSMSIQDYLGALSLGNIGESQKACDRLNAAATSEIKLSCSLGKL